MTKRFQFEFNKKRRKFQKYQVPVFLQKHFTCVRLQLISHNVYVRVPVHLNSDANVFAVIDRDQAVFILIYIYFD